MKNNNKLLPPTYFLILLITTLVLHVLFPIAKIVLYPLNLLGFVFMAFGIIIIIWADKVFKIRKTTVKPFERPSVLITERPFNFSRHPMYLGFVLILLGLAILLGSLSSLITPIAMFIILEIQFIPHEEETLEKVFGQEYRNYKQRVRRWL